MPSAQVAELVVQFPATYSALKDTFLPSLPFAVTDSEGKNVAGHVLYHLRRVEDHALAMHGADRASRVVVDRECAAETRYQASRRVTFRNPVPALGTCWFNRVHERGEKFRPAVAEMLGRRCDTPAELKTILSQIGARK